jgi:Transglycosylase SLT domain/Sel1 repeat
MNPARYGPAAEALRRARAAVFVALGCLACGPVHADADDVAAAHVVALRNEARAFEHGEGVARDPGRAIALYCEASRQGDAEAQFSLGWMYANGRGIPRDNRMASLFFGLAAEQGHDYARKMRAFVGPAAAEPPDCLRDPAPPPMEEAAEFLEPDDDFVAATPEQKKIADVVGKLAPEFRVSPLLALAIIRAESNFDPNARSPKNAQGLMQLIPETSARFNVKKPFDPVQNVRGGLAYLRWLLAYFKGDVALVAAAYNAGEGTVERYRGVPPYAETLAYVQRIKRYYRKDRHPYDATVTEPSPELWRIRMVTAQ